MPSDYPETIDKFQILQSLGEGGMGRLYLGRDPDIGRLVAIKLLREGFDSQEFRERFNREAKSASALRHANIVTVFQTGTHQGQPFIVMEYIQGETLADLIRRKAPLTLERKLQLMDELSAGLQYAHRKGVIHRDIKPANIMLDEDGVLRILDFGIARFGGASLTQTGAIMGTLNYMAPEQLAGIPVDVRADIFSAGAVFYELLSHRRAFQGDFPAVLQQIAINPPEPLERLDLGLDVDLIAVVNRCLSKSPEDRYPDCGAVREALVSAWRRIADASGESTIRVPVLRSIGDRGELPRVRAEQIRRHIDSARHALDDANYSKALEACQGALVLDPECAEALDLENRARTALQPRQLISRWLADATTALKQGDATAASVLVDRALSLSSDSPEALAVRRAVDEARRKWSETQAARQVSTRLADTLPELKPATAAKAVTEELQARPKAAKRVVARSAVTWRAGLLVAVFIIGGVVAIWRLSNNPDPPPPSSSIVDAPGNQSVVTDRLEALRSAARDAWQRSDREAALSDVAAALALQPDDAETRALVDDFVRQMRERAAAAAADARMRQAQGTPMYVAALGRESEGARLHGLRRSTEAARAFTEAADLFAQAAPERPTPPPTNPLVPLSNPQPIVARGVATAAVAGRITALIKEAEGLRLRRDYDEAIDRYLEALKLAPQDDNARAGLAETRAAKQRADDALQKLAGSSSTPPTFASLAEAEAQRLVGVALKAMDTGDDATAQRSLEEALRVNPRNESAQKLLKALTGR